MPLGPSRNRATPQIVVHTGCVLGQIRGWFDGAGAFVAGAVVLLVIAILALLLELQLPTAVLWTGQAVTGTERGGIAFLQGHGPGGPGSAAGHGVRKDGTGDP